jgi:Peptidase A4 family
MLRREMCRTALAAGAMTIALGAFGAGAATLGPQRPTNIPGITTSPEPPAMFDAVHASDEALATYGFPPRPSATNASVAYTHWANAVGAHPQRLSPQLQLTDVFHGPNANRLSGHVANAATSTNWSGYAVTTSASAWSSASVSSVAGDQVVPAVTARTCNSTWEYSSTWVGIDGFASDDVLQAGVEADAECSRSGTQTYYSAWYEWYPYASTRISNLSAAPGQSFYIHVWAVSATLGYAYLQNLNTNQSVSITLAAPSGTTLAGESAEWIVESPTVSGSLATLPSYGLDFFEGATSTTRAAVTGTPASLNAVAISLVRSGVVYSTASLLGANGILFTSH